MTKSWNCKSKCRSKWHTNEELRKRHGPEGGLDSMAGKIRAYYDVVLTPKQAYELMKKVMDELEETGDWKE